MITIQMRPNWLLIPLITLCVMGISGYIIHENIGWFLQLKMPPIIPSDDFITKVWQLIYVTVTGSVLLLYNMLERTQRFWIILTLFTISALLHLYLVYLFFTQHQLGWSILFAVVLALILILLIRCIFPISYFVAFLIVPYAVWMVYMAFLYLWLWAIN